ncbi:hypothetical protein [uncultured Bacteroides sp.]|uniref:hypothetical protein n=1 Tax=uncultured Bacteroides sp. TaxID=162156 RepID=UPI0025E99801|nr:hypothetical protein [uncultured Bacteroides sp.]
MKKNVLLTLISILSLAFVPMDTYGQGFLKKLKQKVEKTVGMEQEDEPTRNQNEDTAVPTAQVSATDIVPKLRQSTVIWDGEVQPSRAANARALLKELPALPSANEIAAPSDASRTAYYNKLSAIDMRVDELDRQYACSDEEMAAARENIYRELTGILGLSVEEMKRLEDPNITESERQRLTDKASAHMMGGNSPEDISNMAASKKGRLDQLQKEIEAIEAKERKGTLTEADKKRAAEISEEMMPMLQEMMNSMSGVIATAEKSAAFSAKVAKYQDRASAYADKVAALRKTEDGVVKDCRQIAEEYESQLKGIYEQIWAESNPVKIHSLYDEADRLMKNYRTRAATIYLSGLRLRLDNAKKMMTEAEQLYADMADGELIPRCAARRAPLNVVTDCIDILNEAYTSFPQPGVLPVKNDKIALLKEGERLLLAESGFAGGFVAGGSVVDDFVKNSRLLVHNETDNSYYEISGGKRTRLDGDGPFDFRVKASRPAETYGEIPLRGGGRKAVYSRDGSLTLHDGTILYPLVMSRHSDRLEFIILDYSNEGLMKCTYKL